MPALSELSDDDLDQIRLIIIDSEKRVKKEIKSEITVTNTKVDGLDTQLRNVETDIVELRGRNIGFSVVKDWIVALCAVTAIIISIVALRKQSPIPPQEDAQKALSQ